MSLARLLKRVAADLLDVPSILVGLVIFYLILNFTSVPLYDAVVNSVVEYLATGSIAKSMHVFFLEIVSPVALLGILLTLVFYLFLSAFVVARIWQRRTKKVDNPFLLAFKKILHVFVAMVFVSFLPLILFFLFVLYQAVPPWNAVFMALFYLSLILWVPLALPVVPASVVESVRGRDVVYEGLLAGKLYWWKTLALLILGSIVFYFLLPLLSVPVLGPSLYQALQLIYVLSVATEAYYSFKHGE